MKTITKYYYANGKLKSKTYNFDDYPENDDNDANKLFYYKGEKINVASIKEFQQWIKENNL